MYSHPTELTRPRPRIASRPWCPRDVPRRRWRRGLSRPDGLITRRRGIRRDPARRGSDGARRAQGMHCLRSGLGRGSPPPRSAGARRRSRHVSDARRGSSPPGPRGTGTGPRHDGWPAPGKRPAGTWTGPARPGPARFRGGPRRLDYLEALVSPPVASQGLAAPPDQAVQLVGEFLDAQVPFEPDVHIVRVGARQSRQQLACAAVDERRRRSAIPAHFPVRSILGHRCNRGQPILEWASASTRYRKDGRRR